MLNASNIKRFAELLSKKISGAHSVGLHYRGRSANSESASEGRNTSAKSSDGVDDVELLTSILTNMIMVGKIKRDSCIFFNTHSGICTLLRFELHIPTLTLVNEGGSYRIVVNNHPEVCAACPYWKEKRGASVF